MSEQHKKEDNKIPQIQPIWGLLCSLSSIDQERNNISLFNIIDQINLPPDFFSQQKKENKPLVFPFLFEIIILWRRTFNLEVSSQQSSIDCKLKLIDPTGNVLQETLVPLIFPEGMRRMRSRIKISGLVVTIPGDYVYEIEVRQQEETNFKKVDQIPFEIKTSRNSPR